MENQVEVEITSVPDNIAKILSKFDGINARFWGVNDPEYLDCSDPVEAILDWASSTLDFSQKPLDAEATLREEIQEDFEGQITVDAYLQEKVSPEFIADASNSMLDMLAEQFAERYGNDDGEYTGSMNQKFLDRFTPKMRALVTLMCEAAEVWRCDIVGSVELSTDEVVALVKHFSPEMFNE